MLQNALIRLKLSLSTKISGHWPADDSRWWWLSRWQWWRSAVHCLVEVCCCCTPLLLCWKSAAAAPSALHTFHHAQTKPQLIPSPIRVMVWKPSCLHIKWHTWQRSSSPFHVSLLADFDTKSRWLQTIFGWIIIRLCVKHWHWLRHWHACLLWRTLNGRWAWPRTLNWSRSGWNGSSHTWQVVSGHSFTTLYSFLGTFYDQRQLPLALRHVSKNDHTYKWVVPSGY